MNKYFGRKDLSQLQLLRIGMSSPRCRHLHMLDSEAEEKIEQKLQIGFPSAIFLSLAGPAQVSLENVVSPSDETVMLAFRGLVPLRRLALRQSA